MKKNVFSLAVVIPLENKIEYIAHSQFSLIKYISNLTPRSPPPPPLNILTLTAVTR